MSGDKLEALMDAELDAKHAELVKVADKLAYTRLKPCPACGSNAELSDTVNYGVCVECVSDECALVGPGDDRDGAKWNAMLRPADIVAARIEGLREGFEIARFGLDVSNEVDDTGDSYIEKDFTTGGRKLDARIAELEAAAPEVSDMRAKAEAFDTGAGT